MKVYNIAATIKVPTGNDVVFSIAITNPNPPIAGYSIAALGPPSNNIYYGSDDKTEVTNQLIDNGSNLNGKTLSLTTSLSKFTSSLVSYKVTISSGGTSLFEKEIDDSTNNNICIYSIFQFTN